MAPAVTIDNTPDFDMPTGPSKPATSGTHPRTLLLAPPSVSAHPEALTQVAAAYDRNATDIQMLDRLALGLVALPEATYDVVLLLTDVDNISAPRPHGSESSLDRDVMEKLARSLKAGGRLQAQQGSLENPVVTEAILAGLVRREDGDGMTKPESTAGEQTVKLSFGGRKKKANAAAVPLNGVEAANTSKRKSEDVSTGNGALAQGPGSLVRVSSAGVGFVDSHDDFDGGFDDGTGYDEDDDMEIPDDAALEAAGQIDPDTLLTEEDRRKPIIVRKYHPEFPTPCCLSVYVQS